jgi:hypothetical protein
MLNSYQLSAISRQRFGRKLKTMAAPLKADS